MHRIARDSSTTTLERHPSTAQRNSLPISKGHQARGTTSSRPSQRYCSHGETEASLDRTTTGLPSVYWMKSEKRRTGWELSQCCPAGCSKRLLSRPQRPLCAFIRSPFCDPFRARAGWGPSAPRFRCSLVPGCSVASSLLLLARAYFPRLRPVAYPSSPGTRHPDCTPTKCGGSGRGIDDDEAKRRSMQRRTVAFSFAVAFVDHKSVRHRASRLKGYTPSNSPRAGRTYWLLPTVAVSGPIRPARPRTSSADLPATEPRLADPRNPALRLPSTMQISVCWTS